MDEDVVVPPAAEPGDCVAVIAPSSGRAATFRPVFALAVERLEEHFDVEPVVDPTARQSDAYLGAHPEARPAAARARRRRARRPPAPIPTGGRVEIDPGSETIRFP